MAKKHISFAQQIKAMAKICGKDIMLETKLPKKKIKRKKETKPRVMYEKKLEKEIILLLDLKGYKVAKAGEDATYNSKYILHGMSDLLVFVPNCGVIFMEVKTDKGKQRYTQKNFEYICSECNLKYVLVRSIHDALNAVEEFENESY